MSADVIPISAAQEEQDSAAIAAEFLYLAHREPVFRYLRAVTGDEDEALDRDSHARRDFEPSGQTSGPIASGPVPIRRPQSAVGGRL